MKEITIENKPTIKYETSDGLTFDNQSRAELHEKSMEFAEKVKLLKYIGGAYYCKTQEDFDAIVDMIAYRTPYYSLSKYAYIPSYHYSKSSFKGADWYFFEYKYNNDAADDYWVETLSEKKAEWEEFYKQFEEEK